MTKCLLARECINASRHLVEMGGIEPRPTADPEFFSEHSLRFYFLAPSIA